MIEKKRMENVDVSITTPKGNWHFQPTKRQFEEMIYWSHRYDKEVVESLVSEKKKRRGRK